MFMLVFRFIFVKIKIGSFTIFRSYLYQQKKTNSETSVYSAIWLYALMELYSETIQMKAMVESFLQNLWRTVLIGR